MHHQLIERAKERLSITELSISEIAYELGPVRVNCIRPGFVETGLWNFLTEEDSTKVREKIRTNFPTRRIGRPADIGHAAVFLMTNPFVTGSIPEVSGGEQLIDWQF